MVEGLSFNFCVLFSLTKTTTMATGNASSDATSVCSLCLEPILLPCLHTVCLPRLKDMEEHHMDETLACDICKGGKEATYSCTECDQNMCDQCQRCHNNFLSSHQVQPLTFSCQETSQMSFEPFDEGTVTDQLKVLEAALVAMTEEEDTLKRERQAVADVISRRADAVRALVTQAEKKSQRALAEVAERLGRRIQAKIITARDRYCRIWQFSSQGGAKARLTSVSRHEQTALLSSDDFQIYKQQGSRGRQIKTLLHQFDDYTIDQQAIEDHIGKVCIGTKLAEENISSLLSISACSETRTLEWEESDTLLTSLPSDTTKLARDNANMKERMAALETVTNGLEEQLRAALKFGSLKEEDFDLQSHVVSLIEVDSRMQQNIDTLQQNENKIRGNFSNLQNDITSMQREFQTMKTINLKLQNDVDRFLQESSLIKTETKKLQDAAEELTKSFKTFKDKASTSVAFNARLHEDSLSYGVILSVVDCNVGEAYNNTTGVFTIPVTGIYFFMASAMAAEEPAIFNLDITVDGKLAAESGSPVGRPRQGVNCTVHLVQRLIQGQKVELSLMCTVNLRHGETSFSGMLVQPEFDIL